MPKVLITGMSGTGKSAALHMLGARGHHVVDTDTDQWSHWVTLPDGSPDCIWREDAIATLLASHQHGHLFVAACKTNQGKFYPQFDLRRDGCWHEACLRAGRRDCNDLHLRLIVRPRH
jgi:hypothetical protein